MNLDKNSKYFFSLLGLKKVFKKVLNLSSYNLKKLCIVHPAVSSSGSNAHKPSYPPERNDSSDQATILHCSKVQVWYSPAHCRRFCSEHGSSLTANPGYATLYAANWHLPILASIRFYSNLSNSSHASMSLGPMTLMPVHWLNFLVPLYQSLHNGNTLQDLLLWRCSNPVA